MSELGSAPVPELVGDDHVRGPADAPLIIEGMRFSVPMLRVGVNRVVAPEEEANIVLELDTAELSGQVLDDVVPGCSRRHPPAGADGHI